MRLKILAQCVALCIIAGAADGIAAPSTQPAADKSPSNVNIGAYTAEVMKLHMDGKEMTLAMWFPTDFFVVAGANQSGESPKAVAKSLAFLQPYLVIVAQASKENDDGTKDYEPEASLRERAVLVDEKKAEVKPLKNPPANVAALAAAMSAAMADQKEMHVLVFPLKSPAGNSLVDLKKKGKLTLVLHGNENFKETTSVWHTPFDATTPTNPCKKCHESLSAKWNHCPWCGQKVEP